jgi:mono/diheme cytochrome c family protein
MRRWAFIAVPLFLMLGMYAEAAAAPSAERGRAFALTNCARCHSIDKTTPSPLSIAPPFRTLHTRYPIDSLQEALVEGIVTGHPTMPEFQLDPGNADDLIKFMKTLER